VSKNRLPALMLVLLIAVVVVGGIAFRVLSDRRVANNAASSDDPSAVSGEEQVAVIVASEDWILSMTNELPALSRSVLNLHLPDVEGRSLFSETLRVRELQAGTAPARRMAVANLGVESISWAVEDEAQTAAAADLNLWKPLFDEVSWFERGKFYFVKAHFIDEEQSEIDAHMNFDGVARTYAGDLLHVQGKQLVRWKKKQEHDSDQQPWQICDWNQKSLKATRRDRTLFHEVVDEVIPPASQSRVRESEHEKLLLNLGLQQDPKEPHTYFSVHASSRHPSVSVVDIDRDGFDDLYVMARWGHNLMLRNRGDGTFEDIAGSIGLDIKDHCASAIFADFDNDGDTDLFLGRTLERSMYLMNEGGRFVDRTSSHVSIELPYLTFAVSAADYNSDGLLDVYLATYGPEQSKPDARTQQWLGEFLPKEQAEELYTFRTNHPLLKRAGPPNVLLMNTGDGKFDLSPQSDQLATWRQTTQATWSDFDGDGDQDLYLTNDYASNTMYRNDAEAGFVDITTSSQTADVGFGMGASFGDYDRDGRQDLYVCNMFSKAGRRITSQIDSLDPRFAKSARGNSLFQNHGDGKFEKVSGLEPPTLLVEKAGWAWSGQFVDIDNDGYLDIHALSGYYTAPKQIAFAADY